MIISISGASNSGKTTLINELLDRKDNPFYPISSPSRRVIVNNKDIHLSSNTLQLLICDYHQHYFNELLRDDWFNKIAVLDRCLLDNYIFTLYLEKKGQILPGISILIKGKLMEQLSKLDYVFVLSSKHIKKECDGVREKTVGLNEDFDDFFISECLNFRESYNKETTGQIKKTDIIIVSEVSINARVKSIYDKII